MRFIISLDRSVQLHIIKEELALSHRCRLLEIASFRKMLSYEFLPCFSLLCSCFCHFNIRIGRKKAGMKRSAVIAQKCSLPMHDVCITKYYARCACFESYKAHMKIANFKGYVLHCVHSSMEMERER